MSLAGMILTEACPLLVLGAGGHARVLIDALQQSGAVIRGILDPEVSLQGTSIMAVPVLGADERVRDFQASEIRLVNGLGSVRDTTARRRLFETMKAQGYSFATVIHPTSIVAPDVQLGEGVQVLANAVVNTAVVLQDNVIVNTAAVVEHDCQIGAHSHIAPRATLAGGVSVGQGCHIGLAASVLQNLSIGESSLVAAGAVVVRAVPAGHSARGVPARMYPR